MQCKVEGCDSEARYKADQLCQKHYHRQWRYGTTDAVKRVKARERIEDKRGYQYIYAPDHPLTARGQWYIGEHRAILYAALGSGPMQCAICGCALTWATCQADHIDENPRNNNRDNLRPTCRPCNTRRGRKPEYMYSEHKVTFEGETKTPTEWSRDPRVHVSRGAIVARLRAGMTPADALFAPKMTHNGKPPKPTQRKTEALHQRSNAVAITCNGKTLTAAEWAREPGVTVSRAGLIWRLRQGWEPSRALFQLGRFA